MNRTLASLILTATLSASMGVSSLGAAESEIANVPFAFHVQSRTMPAGQYRVTQFNRSSNKSLFSIADVQGHSLFVSAPLMRQANPDKPKLIFACYQGDCSLAKIDLPGSQVGYELIQHNSRYSLGLATQLEIKIAH